MVLSIRDPPSRDIRKADGGFAADMYTRREDEKFHNYLGDW